MGTPQRRFEAYLAHPGWLGDALGALEAKTGVNRSYLATDLSLSALGALPNPCEPPSSPPLIAPHLGFSIRAIESPAKDDDTTWLTYWVVYGMFSVVEFFSDTFLYWFPFYYAGKCLFLLWCMAPFSWNGSQVLYRSLIRPWFLKHHQTVDSVLSDLTGRAASVASAASREGKVITMSSVVGGGEGGGAKPPWGGGCV
uniref:Receptor expression-enhancing protein n=1 Tax=Naja naja TaxID=35670 RepID=A0A8C6VHR5_NAJNA